MRGERTYQRVKFPPHKLSLNRKAPIEECVPKKLSNSSIKLATDNVPKIATSRCLHSPRRSAGVGPQAHHTPRIDFFKTYDEVTSAGFLKPDIKSARDDGRLDKSYWEFRSLPVHLEVRLTEIIHQYFNDDKLDI
eukprot:804008_1